MTDLISILPPRLRPCTLSQAAGRETLDALEAVGPWLLTLVCLAVMGLSAMVFSGRAPVVFYLMLTYATAISLIVTAPLHTMLNRHLADEIFLGRLQSVVNGLLATTVAAVAACLATAGILVGFLSHVMIHLKIAFTGLTALMGLFWCIAALVCALRKERLLLYLFAAGMSTSLSVFLLLRPETTEALIFTFSLGMAIPVAGSYAYVVKSYLRENLRLDWSFLHRRHNRKLGAALLVFNIGFWIDKFVFWYAPSTGQALDPMFHFYGDYDFPFFIALTVMMIGSVLVYRGIKRRISGPYEAFIFKLANNFPFRELALEKFRIVAGISQVSTGVMVFYGGVAIFVLMLVYQQVVSLPWQNPFVFHYLLIGSVFFSLFFLYFLVLQYLDETNGVLGLSLLFGVLNAGISIASLHLGWNYYGIGFMLAAMVAALAGFAMVNRIVGGLEFEVFRKALKEQEKTVPKETV